MFSFIFPIVLILATVACALVAGLLFAFAIVTMPGINRLNDGEFIRAFQVMDGVIQNNHPLFMLVWLGSVAALLLAALPTGALTFVVAQNYDVYVDRSSGVIFVSTVVSVITLSLLLAIYGPQFGVH